MMTANRKKDEYLKMTVNLFFSDLHTRTVNDDKNKESLCQA